MTEDGVVRDDEMVVIGRRPNRPHWRATGCYKALEITKAHRVTCMVKIFLSDKTYPFFTSWINADGNPVFIGGELKHPLKASYLHKWLVKTVPRTHEYYHQDKDDYDTKPEPEPKKLSPSDKLIAGIEKLRKRKWRFAG